MQNAFAFEWMLDFLSLGTTNLYRKYMIGALVTVEEGVWRRLGGGTCNDAEGAFNFDKFDETYPDLVPSERLHNYWPDVVEELEPEVDEDRGLRTQVCLNILQPLLLTHFRRVADPRVGQASNESSATAWRERTASFITCIWRCCDHVSLMLTRRLSPTARARRGGLWEG
jgi:hypothetical protein